MTTASTTSTSGAVRIIANLSYTPAGEAPPKQRLDLYLPQQTQFATLCFVHGGALMMGDKRIVRSLGITCARAGIGLAAINHRLSPAVAHPAHIQDVAAALAWVLRNISGYGGDATRIGVGGHSSGAYLAALLTADATHLRSNGVEPNSIRAVVPISGFFHVERVAPERPKHVWGADPAVWPATSPATHARAPQPPTQLLYADGDDDARRQESIDYAATLKALGTTVVLQEIPDRDHRSIFLRMNDAADPTVAAMFEFLRRHLD